MRGLGLGIKLLQLQVRGAEDVGACSCGEQQKVRGQDNEHARRHLPALAGAAPAGMVSITTSYFLRSLA